MAKSKPEELTRRNFLGVSIGAAVLAGIGCGTDSPTQSQQGTAGQPGSGGATGKGGSGTSGGAMGNGGATANGGATGIGGAGTNGGATGIGGAGTNGGATANGGAATGGTSTANGGATTGGVANGGAATGGTTAAGGKGGTSATGGTTAAGGKGGTSATGGSATGGVAGGGAVSESLVYLERNTDVIQAVMNVIAQLNAQRPVNPALINGKIVMLRPNAIDTASPGSVNPDVIRGVIRAIKLIGTPSKILVADDTFTGGTLARMDANLISQAALDEGAIPGGLEGGATTIANPTGATQWPSGIPFYNAVRDAGYVINIPVCKTHGSANFSMALKGWYGNVPNSARSQSHSNVTTLGSTMAEMHLVRKEDLIVLDATKCLLTGGPQVGNGTVASPGIVLATTDAVVADVTGLCILKHYIQLNGTANLNTRITGSSAWAQPQIVRAMALTTLGWLTSKQSFPYSATGIPEAATIMAYRDL